MPRLRLIFTLSLLFLSAVAFGQREAASERSPAKSSSNAACGCIAYAEASTGDQLYYALGTNCTVAKRKLRKEIRQQNLSTKSMESEEVDGAAAAQLYIQRKAKRVARKPRELRR